MPTPDTFPFLGGALCLDFLNTVVEGHDLLTDFASFVRWLKEAGVLSSKQAGTITKRWDDNQRAADTLAAAKNLRAVLRAAVRAFADGQQVPGPALRSLNEQLAGSFARTELVEGADGQIHKHLRHRWQETEDLLAPLAESAADLLTTADRSFIHQCEGEGCTLVFYDQTKNHRRRWCSAAVCGNRAKVAAFRARQHQATQNKR